LIDYLCVSGKIDTNVLEFVDHLHGRRSFLPGLTAGALEADLSFYLALAFASHAFTEHFTDPCTINELGHYNVPQNPDEGYSMGMHEASKAEFVFPHGKYWSDPKNMKIHGLA
jgi:L-fuconate dehydratase